MYIPLKGGIKGLGNGKRAFWESPLAPLPNKKNRGERVTDERGSKKEPHVYYYHKHPALGREAWTSASKKRKQPRPWGKRNQQHSRRGTLIVMAN